MGPSEERWVVLRYKQKMYYRSLKVTWINLFFPFYIDKVEKFWSSRLYVYMNTWFSRWLYLVFPRSMYFRVSPEIWGSKHLWISFDFFGELRFICRRIKEITLRRHKLTENKNRSENITQRWRFESSSFISSF